MSHGWLYIAVNMLNHFFIIQFCFNKTSNKKHTVKKGMIYVPSYNTHSRREYIQVSCLLFDLVQFIHILKKIFVKLIIHTLLLMKYLLRKNNCTHLILIFRYTQFVVLVCFFIVSRKSGIQKTNTGSIRLFRNPGLCGLAYIQMYRFFPIIFS